MNNKNRNLAIAANARVQSKHRDKYLECIDTEERSLLLFTLEQSFPSDASEHVGQAIAQVGFSKGTSIVSLQLSGSIMLDAEKDFAAFVNKMRDITAELWQLHLKDLKTLSSKAFWSLIKLARRIKRYGGELEIIDINPTLLELLLEHRVCNHFRIKLRKKTLLSEIDVNLIQS